MSTTGKTIMALGLLIVVSLCIVEAGDMEPAGAPAPTMVTLQQLHDLFSNCRGGVPLLKTGETSCTDDLGVAIACAGTGQDGELQNGIAATPRFTDNGDGTVTDNLTGLTWLQDAGAIGFQNWNDSLADAAALADPQHGLSDGSVAGDWRLPSIKELQTMVDYSQTQPSVPAGHPFSGVMSHFYWTSTTNDWTLDDAWCVSFTVGHAIVRSKVADCYVWPVRGGV